MRSAQTHAVLMEIKDMVSHLHTMNEWLAYLRTLAERISAQEGMQDGEGEGETLP